MDTEHTHGVTFIVCKMVSLLVCEDPYLEINQSAVVEKLLFIIADRTVVLLWVLFLGKLLRTRGCNLFLAKLCSSLQWDQN